MSARRSNRWRHCLGRASYPLSCSHPPACPTRTARRTKARPAAARCLHKRVFFSTFPIFVPSPSWQIDRCKYKMASQKTVSHRMLARRTCRRHCRRRRAQGRRDSWHRKASLGPCTLDRRSHIQRTQHTCITKLHACACVLSIVDGVLKTLRRCDFDTIFVLLLKTRLLAGVEYYRW